MNNKKEPVELDVTGLLCPMPVLRARRFIEQLDIGQTLLVKASDPATVHDLPAFCKMAGHKLIMASSKNKSYIFEIEKGQPLKEGDND